MTAYVDDVPRHARFNLYDRVVTSGYSSIFPPGISVGKIIHVYNSPDGLSYRLMVQLSTNFSTLRDVCVIDNYSLEERQQLMQAANDSIKANENNSTE
jgi:rod shape-determining protein MreC